MFFPSYLFLFSLASIPTFASSNRPIIYMALPATYKFNHENYCKASFGANWLQTLPDTCIPTIDVTGRRFNTLEVIYEWPVCENGTEAKLGVFDYVGDTYCDGRYLKKLVEKKHVLYKGCFHLEPGVGSLSFWCEGPTPLERKEPTEEERKGGLRKYTREECDTVDKPKPEFYAVDTCIDLVEGNGLEFSRPATCKNGTRAMAAGFKGKGCNPTDQPLKDPFTVWDDRYVGMCIPTNKLNSMAFWCDGFDGIDMTKSNRRKSNLGLILGLSLGVGGLVVIGGGVIAAYYTNWHFRTWVQVRTCSRAFQKMNANLMIGTFPGRRWIHCFVNSCIGCARETQAYHDSICFCVY